MLQSPGVLVGDRGELVNSEEDAGRVGGENSIRVMISHVLPLKEALPSLS
jgi:hypothetical protein